jgi:hypothetical protein
VAISFGLTAFRPFSADVRLGELGIAELQIAIATKTSISSS